MRRKNSFSSMGLPTLLALSVCSAPACYGQSFLDKLEKTVKEQLSESTIPVETEELPAPGNSSVQGSRAPQATVPQATAPRTTSPQVVRPPVIRSGPVQNASPTSVPKEAAGETYLGIEVESPPGSTIGVRIATVEDRSPAWKAGMTVGDRILAINGYAIANIDGMVTQLSKTRPGQAVRFLISRGGRNKELTAVLMDANLAAQIQGQTSAISTAGEAWLGVKTNDLTAGFRKQFGLSIFRGAAIVNVTPGSPAAKAGIRPGEVIADANGTPIDRAEALMAWVANAKPGQKVELLLYKGARSRIVEIVLEANPNSRLSPQVSSSPVRNQAPTVAVAPTAQPNMSAQVETRPLELSPSVLETNQGPANNSNLAGPPSNGLPSTGLPLGVENASSELELLRAENAQLKSQLDAALGKLESLQTRLNGILNELNPNE